MTSTAPTSLTGTYLLDPTRTRLRFVARQALVAKVRGEFAAFAGWLHLDFADPARSRAEVTIDVESLTTGNARRDEHLRDHFFDTALHPQIALRSSGVEPMEDDRFRLTGLLTINGRTRAVVLDVVHTGTTMGSDGRCIVSFHGRTGLDRREWGVSWNTAVEGGGAFVSNRVAIELDVVAVRALGPLVD